MPYRWSLPASLLVVFIAGSGCYSSQKSKAPPPAAGVTLAGTEVDTAVLVGDLHHFLDRVYIRMIGVADEVIANSSSAQAREAALRLKIRVAATTQAIAAEPDPRLAFCSIWIVLVEAQTLFATAQQQRVLGEFQPRVLKAANELEGEVVAIGRRHFSSDVMEQAKPQIEALAAGNAVSGQFITGFVTPGALNVADDDPMGKILTLPLSPLTGLQGVADTPTAITRSTAIVANLIQNLPERARWEAEMLLPEVREQAEMLVSQVRKEVDSIIGEVNASQAPLQQTLKEAKETVAQVDAALDKVESLAVTADEIVGQLKEVAVAWDDTAKSANVLVASIQQLVDSTAKEPQTGSAEESDSASVKDYLNAATDIREATTQLNSAIGRLESDRLDVAVAHVEELLNAVTVRAVIVIGALLAGLILYRAASVKLTRSAR